MAGGSGTRFWPLSRLKSPKQFLPLIGDQTFFEQTINRLHPLISKENLWVISNINQKTALESSFKSLAKEHLLLEPIGRNTAPCITWATIKVLREDPEAVMVVLPSDHMIKDTDAFQKTIQEAIETVKKEPETLVTIGIHPTSPHTGYGYIQTKSNSEHLNCHSVIQFKEKPDLETAKNYLKTGTFYWNSGIFVWKAKTLLSALERHLPDLTTPLYSIKKSENETKELEKIYPTLPKISIDYGLLEKVPETIRMIPAKFDWDDVGSWSALTHYLEKDKNNNIIKANTLTHNSQNNFILSNQKKIITLCNVEHIAVIETDDALLVMDLRKDQDIKHITDQLPSEWT